MAYTIPESSGADSGVVYIFEVHCMTESSCVRLCGVCHHHTWPPSWTDIAQLYHCTLTEYFWSLHSFRFSVHDVNIWTAYTADFCVFFTTIGFL